MSVAAQKQGEGSSGPPRKAELLPIDIYYNKLLGRFLGLLNNKHIRVGTTVRKLVSEHLLYVPTPSSDTHIDGNSEEAIF